MSDFLEHHGIKGQKWGVQHGPPYPLNKQLSLRIKNYKTIASRNRSSKENSDVLQYEKYSNKQWKQDDYKELYAIKINRVYQSSRDDSGLYRIPGKHTIDDDCKNANPGYTKNYITTTNNCLLSAIAYNMRRKGYNVIARQKAPIDLLYDINIDDLHLIYSNMKVLNANDNTDLHNKLSKMPNGSHGIITMSWNTGTGGHAIAWEKTLSGIKYVDAQSGEVKTSNYTDNKDIRYARLDNIPVDFNGVMLCVE